MSEHLHLVFSDPPPEIDEVTFNEWYDFHLGEILVVPGFRAARRYRLHVAVGSGGPARYRFLSAYELEAPPAEVMVALDEEVASERMQLPEWFPEVRFASFNCYSHGDASEPSLGDHLYLVFSAPPSGVDAGLYVRWYGTHAAENTSVAGFEASWRFRLEPVVVDATEPTIQDHLALYGVSKELAELRAGLDAAKVNGAIGFPTWFDQIPFVSLDAHQLGGRVRAEEIRASGRSDPL